MIIVSNKLHFKKIRDKMLTFGEKRERELAEWWECKSASVDVRAKKQGERELV